MQSWVDAGPGSRLQVAIASSNRLACIQPRRSTTSSRSSAMWAGGPPNPSTPIRPHSRATVSKDGGSGLEPAAATGAHSAASPRSYLSGGRGTTVRDRGVAVRPGRRRSRRPARDADAPPRAGRVRRPRQAARTGLGPPCRDRVRRAAQRGLLRAAGDGQDDPGPDHRGHCVRRLRGALGRQRRPTRGAAGDRARRGNAVRPAGRRSSSSTRSTASTRPSRTRCCRRWRRGC